MKIFGSVLPFIGFRQYYYSLEEYHEALAEGVVDPELEKEINYTISQCAHLSIMGLIAHSFEAEWFNYSIGMVYKHSLRCTKKET